MSSDYREVEVTLRDGSRKMITVFKIGEPGREQLRHAVTDLALLQCFTGLSSKDLDRISPASEFVLLEAGEELNRALIIELQEQAKRASDAMTRADPNWVDKIIEAAQRKKS